MASSRVLDGFFVQGGDTALSVAATTEIGDYLKDFVASPPPEFPPPESPPPDVAPPPFFADGDLVAAADLGNLTRVNELLAAGISVNDADPVSDYEREGWRCGMERCG